MMEAANKEAAEECLSKAQAAFRKGSFKEALRLAEKSSRMCRTKEADGENVKLVYPKSGALPGPALCGQYNYDAIFSINLTLTLNVVYTKRCFG